MGKTSIVRQFLYDQFSPVHTETMDDMYRGEFEDANGLTINFDIQDVGGGFVYEFPGMRNVSLASADAFLLVFSLDSAETWTEVEKLRDMVIEAKVSFIATDTFLSHGRSISKGITALIWIPRVGAFCLQHISVQVQKKEGKLHLINHQLVSK